MKKKCAALICIYTLFFNAKIIAQRDTTTCDYIIGTDPAKEAIKDFAKHYKKNFGKALNLKYKIEKCAWIEMNDKLQNLDGADGIRFFFGKIKNYTNQNLIVVATSRVEYPSETVKHTNRPDWSIKPQNNCSYSSNILFNDIKSTSLINEFGKYFRKESIDGARESAILDSLSLGVWFKKCTIDALASVLKNNSQDLDGIRVHSIAYPSHQPGEPNGQKFPNQSSLIFVPYKMDSNGKIIDMWDIITTAELNQSKVLFKNAANKGELCPQICN
jgi:hypothetical protein